MLKIEHIRVYNKLIISASDHKYYETVREIREGFINNHPLANFEGIELTKEILHDNLGFEVFDMGDHWQFEKGDFVIIQMQVKMVKINMPYMFVLSSSIKGSVIFDSVHHLQNTYLDLKKEVLLWKDL